MLGDRPSGRVDGYLMKPQRTMKRHRRTRLTFQTTPRSFITDSSDTTGLVNGPSENGPFQAFNRWIASLDDMLTSLRCTNGLSPVFPMLDFSFTVAFEVPIAATG
jgi:hypothetical protein